MLLSFLRALSHCELRHVDGGNLGAQGKLWTLLLAIDISNGSQVLTCGSNQKSVYTLPTVTCLKWVHQH